MIDRIIKLLKNFRRFPENRTVLSIFLAWQIFVAKSVRTRPHALVACSLVLIFGIIGIHTGMCPVRYTLTTLCAKLSLG